MICVWCWNVIGRVHVALTHLRDWWVAAPSKSCIDKSDLDIFSSG